MTAKPVDRKKELRKALDLIGTIESALQRIKTVLKDNKDLGDSIINLGHAEVFIKKVLKTLPD